MATILVFCEQRDNTLKRVGFEALGAARMRAGETDCVIAVLLGETLDEHRKTLTAAGADKIILADQAGLAQYHSEAYAQTLADIATSEQATVILMGATAMGKDLGPKVAAKLDGPYACDCIDFTLADDGKVNLKRPIYGGKAIATVQSHQADFQVLSLRPNVFSALDPDQNRTAETIQYDKETEQPASSAVLKEIQASSESKVELTEANIIVSGGRGLKAPENFAVIEALAQSLGAAVGASRAAVDAGWKPHSYQVGLTGKTVSPSLYIACGISGAIQHQAGMSSSKVIVAINKDANAPIFKISNYGIVADLFEIVPRLTEAVNKIKE